MPSWIRSPWARPTSTRGSLFNDTEVNIATCDPVLARRTRLALWAEHLDRPVADVVADVDVDPTTVIDQLWRPIAQKQLHQRNSGLALTHRLMQLHAVSRRAERLIGPKNLRLWDPSGLPAVTTDGTDPWLGERWSLSVVSLSVVLNHGGCPVARSGGQLAAGPPVRNTKRNLPSCTSSPSASVAESTGSRLT